jgi:hypothetical protein
VWAFQGVLSKAQIGRLAEGLPGMDTEVPGDY